MPIIDAPKSSTTFLNLLLNHLGRNKLKIFLMLCAIALSKITLLAVPFTFAKLVDLLISPYDTITIIQIGLISLIGIYCVLSVLGILFQEVKEYFSTKLINQIIADVGESIFWSIHNSPRNTLLGSRLGALARDIDRGLKGLQAIAGIVTYSIAPTLLEVVFVTSYFAFEYPPEFVLVLLATILFYSIYSFYATNRWATSRHEINQTDSNANNKLLESLIKFDLIKFFGREQYEVEQYRNDLQLHASLVTNAQASHSKIIIGQQAIVALGLGIVFFLTTGNIQSGLMTVGDMVLINGLMLSVCAPLAFLGMVYKDTLQNLIDVNKLNSQVKVYSLDTNIKTSDYELDRNTNPLFLRFENVSFCYPGKNRPTPAISDLTFLVKPGTTTAIVGESGSGKSTLARLLFKLYEPSAGKITLNDVDISTLLPSEVRQLISIVPQEPTLFHGTVRDNIAYGNLAASDDKIVMAAKLAQIHEFLDQLPDGYATTVGERGQKISGGEQQRICIARALLKDAPILILDEATASLDAITEEKLLIALKQVFLEKTVLLITHRLQAAKNADLICVMSRGKIIEMGTHLDLISKQSEYKLLWERQLNEVLTDKAISS